MNRTYTIAFHGGDKVVEAEMPCPPVLPDQGTILEFTASCHTLADYAYNQGDKLLLITRTESAPHMRISSLGNWIVKCKHFTSVWTNIEWAMSTGLLKIVDNGSKRTKFFMKVRYEGQFDIYENEKLRLRISRSRNGAPWVLSDIDTDQVFDQDNFRHDLAERNNLDLDLNLDIAL